MQGSSAARVPSDGDTRKRPTRKQDPERTRRALLAAVAEEFSTHGYEGARVTRIAAAAGVGHQLITYHFGGKRGLYDALQERWLDRNDQLISSSEPFAQVARRYVQWVHEDEAWARPSSARRSTAASRSPMSASRASSRWSSRRASGRSAASSAPIWTSVRSLSLLAACIAPAVLPAFARAFVGLDPSSEAFTELYADQIARMIASMGEPDL